jgi:hypothetical protein
VLGAQPLRKKFHSSEQTPHDVVQPPDAKRARKAQRVPDTLP